MIGPNGPFSDSRFALLFFSDRVLYVIKKVKITVLCDSIFLSLDANWIIDRVQKTTRPAAAQPS